LRGRGAVRLAMGVDDALPDRRQQDEVDELRIELTPALGGDGVGGVLSAPGVPVAPAVRDRVEGVGDRDDARGERDPPSAHPTRVPSTVPPLVVREYAVGELGVEAAQWGEDVGAAARVGGDGPAGFRGELGLVVNDVEERLVDLSDVVEECHALDIPALAFFEARGVGDDQSVRGDAADVGAGLRVVRVDRIEQRLEGRGGEALGRASLPVFTDEGRHDGGGSGESGERLHT